MPSYGLSLATIAIVPMTNSTTSTTSNAKESKAFESSYEYSDFCSSVTDSLRTITPTKLLTMSEAKDLIGTDLLRHRNSMLKIKATRILSDIEENHRLVVYRAKERYTW